MNQDEIYNTPISRRAAIRMGVFGAGTLMLSNWSVPAPAAIATTTSVLSTATTRAATAKAKSVIQIWMWGGPCHIDTFDPKPDSGRDYTGPLDKPIETSISGIRVGQLLPTLAKQADKYSLIRSMSHGNNGHETASYIVQTGRNSGEQIVYPGVGAVVSMFKGYDGTYKGLIPPYIVLTEPQGRFSESGFLGNRFKPFATGGDPSQTPFAVEGVVAQGITEQRQRNRRELLEKLNTFGRAMKDDPRTKALTDAQNEAYDLILGDAGKVFDLSQEKNELRDRYGRTKFGQSCLVARRLVERGVPYITINYAGWDTHKQHFQTMSRKLPELDKALATLLQDLSDRGLLESTIVWLGGEFGRTPKVLWEAPWNGGRNHHGKAFSHLIAGGGFKGGCVVGATDDKGETVVKDPIHPSQLIGCIYDRLGIDVHAHLPHPQGIATQVLDEKAIAATAALREIMI